MPRLTFREQEEIVEGAKSDFWDCVYLKLKDMGYQVESSPVPSSLEELFNDVSRRVIEDFIYNAVEGGTQPVTGLTNGA